MEGRIGETMRRETKGEEKGIENGNNIFWWGKGNICRRKGKEGEVKEGTEKTEHFKGWLKETSKDRMKRKGELKAEEKWCSVKERKVVNKGRERREGREKWGVLVTYEAQMLERRWQENFPGGFVERTVIFL